MQCMSFAYGNFLFDAVDKRNFKCYTKDGLLFVDDKRRKKSNGSQTWTCRIPLCGYYLGE